MRKEPHSGAGLAARNLAEGPLPYIPLVQPGRYRGLTCGLVDPVGVDAPSPRLSWPFRLVGQSDVVVSAEGGEVWRGVVPAGAGWTDVPAGVLSPLVPYTWTVGGQVTGAFTTGLLADGAWPAPWAAGDGEAAVCLRGTFDCAGVAGARVWAAMTALGVYRPFLNGERLGEEELAPGWTDYTRRVRYRLVEITDLLRPGRNELDLWLAPGWYAGHVAAGGPHRYGTVPAASAQVLLRTGTEMSGMSLGWTVHDLGRPHADLVMGETFRVETQGAAGEPASAAHISTGIRVEADPAPAVRAIKTVAPVEVLEPEPGMVIVDFGQNLVGRLRLRVEGPAQLRVRHGEELTATGRLYTANLRTALQQDEFVVGPGTHVVEPVFALHGFRYAEISGGQAEVEAVVLTSQMQPTGEFETSDPAVRQLMANIVASAEGNLVSIPTDCPQRDERAGWTADISVFGSTLSFLTNTQAFLASWVQTLIDGQRDDGAIPHVAPVLAEYGYDSPVWSDAIVEVPWLLWRRYGDDHTLRLAYDPMRRWVDYCLRQADGGVRPARSLGDWLAPGVVETPKSLIATAALARSLRLVAHTADVLGEPHAEEYAQAATVVIGAFQEAFLSGRKLRTETQTGYALALAWDLVPPEDRVAVAQSLAELVKSDEFRLKTGFVGTPLLLPVLSETGYHDLACRIFNQEGYPSWRYQLRAGATTMWERWDSWHHRSGLQTPAMNSFNHYAYGCVGDWFFRHVAGVGDDPRGVSGGFGELLLRPGPMPLLRQARARYLSASGQVESGWRAEPDGLLFTFAVPHGVTARALLPVRGTWDGMTVNGAFLMGLSEQLPFQRLEDGSVLLDLPPGRWTFTAPAAAAEPLFAAWDTL